MTDRTVKILVGSVAVLVAAYGATLLSAGSGDGGDRGDGGPVAEALASAAGDLDSVSIAGGDRSMVLTRGSGGWRVDGHPADSASVADLEAALSGGVPLELASRNPDNHARMGVDSASAERVVLGRDGGDVVTLLMGDRGPYGSSVHLRRAGSDEVYLARGDLPRLLRQRSESWRERTLVRLDTGRVASIRVTRDGATYELRRSDGGWTADGEPADSAEVRELLDELDGLAATSFAPDSVTLGPVDRSVTALSSAGDTLASVRVEAVGGESASRHRVATSARDGVFELVGREVEAVTPARDDLLATGGGPPREGPSDEGRSDAGPSGGGPSGAGGGG